MIKRFFSRLNHPLHLTILAVCFALLGAIEMYQAHRFSAENFTQDSTLGRIVTEDFEYRPNFPYNFQAKALFRYGILHTNTFNSQRRDFYFYLSSSESQLLYYRLGKFPKFHGMPIGKPKECKCAPKTRERAIAVYYGPALTPLDYLFLNSYESGKWQNKVYAIVAGVIVDGKFGSGSRPYLAADRMKDIAYSCFLLAAILLYMARKRQKAANN